MSQTRISEKYLCQCPFCCGILGLDGDFQLWADDCNFWAICENVDCSMQVKLNLVSSEMTAMEKFLAAKKEMCQLANSGLLKVMVQEKANRNLKQGTVRPDLKPLLERAVL